MSLAFCVLCDQLLRPHSPIQMLVPSLGSSSRLIGAQPWSQSHVKAPGVLVQMDSGPQTVELKHSSISEESNIRANR